MKINELFDKDINYVSVEQTKEIEHLLENVLDFYEYQKHSQLFMLLPKWTVRIKENELLNKLYEGLILSYNLKTIIQMIVCGFKCKVTTKHKSLNELCNFFAITIYVKDFNYDKLLAQLTKAGWFIAEMQFFNNAELLHKLTKNITKETVTKAIENKAITILAMRFEPKFDTEIEREKLPDKLYCIAPNSVKAKIEKNGLIPKSGKNLDNHPERIYLALDKDKLISEMLPQLKLKDTRYSHHYDNSKVGTILITINTNIIPDHVRFFDDVHWTADAVYTVVNIPPQCIEKIEEIE